MSKTNGGHGSALEAARRLLEAMAIPYTVEGGGERHFKLRFEAGGAKLTVVAASSPRSSGTVKTVASVRRALRRAGVEAVHR